MSDIFEALKQVAQPGSKYAKPKGDKYEQVAIKALNTIQQSMLAVDDEIETAYGPICPPKLQFKKAKDYLSDYLRSQFPEPKPVDGVRELVEALRAKGFIPYCPNHIAESLITAFIEARDARKKTVDTKRNLCETCKNSWPTCRGLDDDDITFGDGIGNDNVCECNCYEPLPPAPKDGE